MSLPENIAIPPLSDCRFYHETPPSIGVVHRQSPQAAPQTPQISQYMNSTSPLLSPHHHQQQLHHPQVGGLQSRSYAMGSNSHGSLEHPKLGFKHNQCSNLQGQSHGNFSPQRRFVPQVHNATSGFRNQQQYGRNACRRKKKDNLPALNQIRSKNTPTVFVPTGFWRPLYNHQSDHVMILFFFWNLDMGDSKMHLIVLAFPSQFTMPHTSCPKTEFKSMTELILLHLSEVPFSMWRTPAQTWLRIFQTSPSHQCYFLVYWAAQVK